MCWNYEVSILSYLVGTMVAILLLRRGKKYDKILGCLILFYSLVQYGEAGIWKSLQTGNAEENRHYSRLIYYILWSQVFALGIGVYLETKKIGVIVLGLALLWYAKKNEPSFEISKPTPETKGHLAWGFSADYYEMVVILSVLICLLYTNVNYTLIMVGFYALTYIISYVQNIQKSVSSYWCWISAVFSFVPFILV